ncbi:LamG-like jellyroll fold domain-containing protein [Actinomadura darangshiensis]|uniref:LamG-like jellyroll fold domain-containing protein n=1 Tax=Actinomadura darangshiensis TaxID=705336 RepID=UPI001FB6D332|nr:LamG-like jellyroll fold domain-containing protein [Actinomadura darangshiensis]
MRRLPTLLVAFATVIVSAVALPPAHADGWQPKTPPLTTPWTHEVGPDNALPDYPRPQLTRKRWQNLNGVWQFAGATAGEKPPVGKDLDERILVPYPVESALSGIARSVQHMWYRRTFTVPSGWRNRGQRLVLQFGAVDHTAKVYVNGREVAAHTGGYNAFSVDVTDALNPRGAQELIVGVDDPTDIGHQAVGKQRKPGDGIFYTPASGIWQTVWMEPVAGAHIGDLTTTPEPSAGRLRLTANASAPGGTVEAIAYAGHKPVGRVTGKAGDELSIRIPHAHLWTPDDPYLYRLKVRLRSGHTVVDEVGSYFGMRSVSLGKGEDGKTRMLLNGKFVPQVGTLDQGYWPDGIYTAPTDEALKFDLAAHKKLGFNMVRKHMKVEPDRWFYWADRLGLLVWQDMPAMFGGHEPSAADKKQFEAEMQAMVRQHDSHPSVIVWVPFNEGWGEYEPGRIADTVKGWDPSRLVNADSGVNCCDSLPDNGEGDIYDDHTYVGPGSPPIPRGDRASVAGEYGGLGLKVDGHMFDPAGSFAYEMTPDSATLTRRYTEVQDGVRKLVVKCGLSASVYTQITDVEKEVNGLYTYDRQQPKMDAAKVREANRSIIAAKPSPDGGDQPPGTPGLEGVSFYPFGEGSGTTTADAVGDHDATLVGGPQWTTGHDGPGLQLKGSSQFADTGAAILDTTGSYSVSAWVKLDRRGSFATAVSQDGPSNSAFFLQYSGADDRFAFSFAGVRALAPAAPETGKWYHLTGVRDAASGSLTLYVDGQKAGAAESCLGDASTGHTVIGRGKFGGNPVDFWPGALDEVRVFDRALSAAEVAELAG